MFDLMIRGGKIIDGTGSPAYRAEVYIRGDRIAEIGGRPDERAAFRQAQGAARILDVDGLIVAPGFIDVHSHYDRLLLAQKPDDSKVVQGVTTEIVGNCGFALAPVNPDFRELLVTQTSAIMGEGDLPWLTFGGYLSALEAAAPPVNVGALAGHNAVRVAAMGFENRPARPDELARMKGYVAEAMDAGALGLSTGLVYPPGTFAKTDEVVELAKVVRPYGGLYASHIRNEANRLIEAATEAITVGEEAGVPVQISHCKASGSSNWGKGAALMRTIREANGRGLDVTGDQYPYLAGSTLLSTLLPPWAHEGGVPELLTRLRSAEMRGRMKHDMEHGSGDWWNPSKNTSWDGVLIAASPRMPEIEGKSLERLVREAGRDPYETLFTLLEQTRCQILMIIFLMTEDDVRTIMRDANVMIGTDALATGSKPHPRSYGTYPRVLGKYVRDERVLDLPEAIRKMTSLPAQKFKLKDRGIIRRGVHADLVIFDPQRIQDTATYDNPVQHPRGVPYVLVNGVFGVDDGRVTGARAGKVLRRG
ncbi:MAG: D-aminoacylase [Chloroflexi bacterium]|nr:D-aminoacylase [Chloroflexota bacterium]